MANNTVTTGWKVDSPAPAAYLIPFKDRLSGFVSLIRPLFFVLTPLNAAAAAVLAFQGYPSLHECVLGFFAVAFASCAINVFNDYSDRERDKVIWPARPIPSGRVKPAEALMVVAISLAISLSIAWLVFNPTTFAILLLAIILGGFYSVFLRDRVGYLSLPPIVGLIYLGGWAAFSPGTLLTDWLPWYLYALGVAWQTAHIMIYYPLHTEGAASKVKAPPALFFTPSPHVAITTGNVFTILTLAGGLGLFYITKLSLFYPAFVVAAGICALFYGLNLYKRIADRRAGLHAFTALSIFRLVISTAILLSVFISGFSR